MQTVPFFVVITTAGCGAERGFVDIDIDSLQPQKRYALDVYANNIKKTVYVTFTSTLNE